MTPSTTPTEAGSAPAIEVRRRVPADHPSFAGHFPGQPLLPGVVLLNEVMGAALAQPGWAAALAQGSALPQAKFLAPVRPDSELRIVLQQEGSGLRFEVFCAPAGVATGPAGGEVLAAKGQWSWTRP